MKTIDLHNACIERISSRKDHSLSFGVSTPELRPEEAAAFLQLHGVNVRLMIQPQDIPAEELIAIDTDIEQKTHSQRLRAVIFVHWNDGGKKDDFETFYRTQMEKIIEGYKTKNLEPR